MKNNIFKDKENVVDVTETGAWWRKKTKERKNKERKKERKKETLKMYQLNSVFIESVPSAAEKIKHLLIHFVSVK